MTNDDLVVNDWPFGCWDATDVGRCLGVSIRRIPFGIRLYGYSADTSKNRFSFEFLKSDFYNSQPCNPSAEVSKAS